jgi:hypothetical protein
MSKKTAGGRTAVEWFHEAERCFVAHHQGCPHCGGNHCVFRSDWGEREEFYCSRCDFSACHDRRSGAYFAVAGNEAGTSIGDSTRLMPVLLFALDGEGAE